MFSCGNNQEGKEVVEVVVKTPEVTVDYTVVIIEKLDTILKLSKTWQSVYYIKNNDTIFSDNPFEIEFINDSNNLVYKLDGKLSEDQKWNFKNNLFETSGIGHGCYKIISLSDSTLRTCDTSKLGFEYFFKIK